MIRSSLCLLALAAGVMSVPANGLHGKFLQVTDFHYDPHYVAGSDPTTSCHRGTSAQGAGKFGTLGSKCDSPPALVEAAFNFMKTSLQDVDFVVYTGDSSRHNRDKDGSPRSEKEVIEQQATIVQAFQQSFDLGRTKIPVIGNNDVFDNNVAAWRDAQYGPIKNAWEPFKLNITNDFSDGGYFVSDIVPGKLRAVGLNTMMFMKKNKNMEDCNVQGGGQVHMQWLKTILEDSAAAGYKVYMLAHVPPHSKKDKPFYKPACQDQYYSLLGTYSHVIVGHFAGHFNNDMLTAVVSSGGEFRHEAALPSQPPVAIRAEDTVAVLFNAPSIIPTNNPAIRVYEYETGENANIPFGTVHDWVQYYVDLDEANKSGQAKFQEEYRASAVFGVNRFDGAGVAQAFDHMSQDSAAYSKYASFVTVSTKAGGETDDDD